MSDENTPDRSRRLSFSIASEAIEAVRSGPLVARSLAREVGPPGTRTSGRIFVIGVGKASHAMTKAVVGSGLGPIADGIIVSTSQTAPSPGWKAFVGDHPVPGNGSVRAASEVLRFLNTRRFHPDDLVLMLVSGGASALLCQPAAPLGLTDIEAVTTALLRSGIDVTRMNQLRAALSSIHSGRILEHTAPARVLSLILNDNVQRGVEAVGSGLTFPTKVDTDAALRVAAEIRPYLAADVAGRVARALANQESRRPPAPTNIEVGGPRLLQSAALAAARRTGRRVIDAGSHLQGEARSVAELITDRMHEERARSGGPGILVASGEVTVTVRGEGTGGRCQELVWAALPGLAQMPGSTLTALASDGQDFVPGVMGATASSADLEVAQGAGLDWMDVLDRNDAGTGLAHIDALVAARATQTNVCDVYVGTWE